MAMFLFTSGSTELGSVSGEGAGAGGPADVQAPDVGWDAVMSVLRGRGCLSDVVGGAHY